MYHPLYRSFPSLPSIDTTTKPVITQAVNKENVRTNGTQSTAKKTTATRSNTSKNPIVRQRPRPRDGYCEICETMFSCFESHGNSESHGKIIENREFWSDLDLTIASFPSVRNLVAKFGHETRVLLN